MIYFTNSIKFRPLSRSLLKKFKGKKVYALENNYKTFIKYIKSTHHSEGLAKTWYFLQRALNFECFLVKSNVLKKV